MNVTIGQRWISQTEPQLGLGIVAAVAGRRVTMNFPAVDEERIYALDNNALSRVKYRSGDSITTKEDIELEVQDVQEIRGIVFYSALDGEGNTQVVSELDLNCFVHFTTPRQRLTNGQLDKAPLYQLRIATLFRQAALRTSRVRGLLGCRTSLLHHQIYIAAEVAQRHAPRVLLADEVGLGKTIEAGLIVHQQLHTGRASRVLIITPESLQHQWLVEMLRRFNLRFSLLDSDRIAALLDSEEPNPFDSEQLVLCSQQLLSSSPEILDYACASHWDMIVVDEAHHLHWSEHNPSEEYRCIERLAGKQSGLLLLTATPEQAGLESHFARLRLLDPARFHCLEEFRREQAGYQEINALTRQLLKERSLSSRMVEQLQPLMDSQWQPSADDELNIDSIINMLLDRHGTSRAMFRNTRAAIPNFPQRELHSYPLPLPALYSGDDLSQLLYPESGFDDEQWIVADPRVTWLQDFLKQHRSTKVLVICARASTALALEYQLHMRAGIRCSAFHEGLSLVERDRAAAWFAETDNGAQALICSEIGSEGRNFQFSQHLVLFDLPFNPDLLEQRIGRLDRIGQRDTITIHVPYLQHCAQQTLFRWFHEGIDLFTQSCSAGYAILEHFRTRLEAQLAQQDEQLAGLIQETREYTLATRVALQEGRDPLLELSSCKPETAAALIADIEACQDNDSVMAYLEQLLDQCGVEHDFHSAYARILRPTEHMLFDYFPGLKEDGVTVTVDREQALSREDMEYLSWEHPMMAEPMEMLLDSELGTTSVISISLQGLPRGTLLLEAIFSVSCVAARDLQIDRYLPATPVRLLLNTEGKDLSGAISHEQLNQLSQKVKRATGQAIINRVRDNLEQMLDTATELAAQQLPGLIAVAGNTMQSDLNAECQRLKALQKINPGIRPQEIKFVEQRIATSNSLLERAAMQPQGLRLIINT